VTTSVCMWSLILVFQVLEVEDLHFPVPNFHTHTFGPTFSSHTVPLWMHIFYI